MKEKEITQKVRAKNLMKKINKYKKKQNVNTWVTITTK